MRRFAPAIITLISILILSAVANAVGKVTVDPNTPSSGSTAAPAPVSDERLSQKVTYEAQRKMVSAIMEDLTKATGVTFKAGYNNGDWQVRDRRMNIIAKDVPLNELTNSMARVMKFKWSLSGEGKSTIYRFYMDRKTLLDAEAQRLREEERLRMMLADKRKSALDEYMNIDSLSAGDLAKMKKDEPFLYILTMSGIASSMGQLFREVPPLSEAMASGEEITLSGDSMSPGGQAGLTGIVANIFKFAQQLRIPNMPSMSDLKLDPMKLSVDINRDLKDQNVDAFKMALLASMRIKGENMSMDMPLINPESGIGRVLGKALVDVQEGRADIKDINKRIDEDIRQAMTSDIEAMDKQTGEPVVKHPEDTELNKKIKLTLKDTDTGSICKALAEASGFAVVSDSFSKRTEPRSSLGFLNDEAELGNMLDQLAKALKYNWEKHAVVIEFRDREWFRKRSVQIPEAQLEAWRKTLAGTGTLDLPDLIDIATLTPEQFNANVRDDDVLPRMGLESAINESRDLLRLYGALSQSQQAAIFTDSGLDIGSLTTEQWAAAQKLISRRDSGFFKDPDARIAITAKRVPNASDQKRFDYDFEAKMADGTKSVHWRFTTPGYKEPEKLPAKTEKPANK